MRLQALDLTDIKARLHDKALSLGFADMGVTGTDVSAEKPRFDAWLARGYHGSMGFLAAHGDKRFHADKLVPDTRSVISVRLDYLPDTRTHELLDHPEQAYIARYALGRDYHKLMRKRLVQLARWLEEVVGPFGYRAFADSAPVLERAVARNAGLGWVGKHTLVLNRHAGSWFFLGELYTDLELPPDPPQATQHCGSCTRCLDVCPTNAFTGPWELDARKCISYLTIEHDGPIPEPLRAPMGNRIFGCDDCQIYCPWTKFTPHTREADFTPRHQLDEADMVALFLWDEATFLQRTEGMAIRRTGYENWLRNLAVALGNGSPRPEALQALRRRRPECSELVQEHIDWALQRLRAKTLGTPARQ
ncbi:tRNA epoxyqueuosine(34) reductase QueG [Natronospirillum operosum]|uniref:Epoxyqueuosine reductase n=1 Tax=Natronospirillum operosum TaxID=2759953 RepID=A0A4Z0W7L7_9GAMM|nr:tRNA epoxyqueuosine(34) reductase QueG [Natronospirillum operosum]TGG94054.1 tRNA epoxyqueuosine(34) reductase QueG [Natronospirillum operosum]